MHAKVQELISQLLCHNGVTWKYTFCTMLKCYLLLWYLFISLSQVFFLSRPRLLSWDMLYELVSFLGPQILCISFNYCQTIFHSFLLREKLHEISIKSIIFFCKNIFTSKNTLVQYSPCQRPLQRQYGILKQIFPEKELCGLSPSFDIHVSVSDLYILGIGLLFCCWKICGPILGTYKSFIDTWMWKLRLRPCNSFSGNT
jgi:hypothetical protein